MMYSDSALSVKDATGRQISLLNDCQQQYQQKGQEQQASTLSLNGKRKYHCTEPGCNKSFTTSGHLARHHRIHSGEKNFHCLHAGCPSRFSRQDNMMQHYRTHLSSKSRRHHQHQQQQSQQSQQKAKNANVKEHQRRLHSQTMVESEFKATIHPLVDSKAVGRVVSDPNAVTRSRRSATMPSSFHPYQQQPSSSGLAKVYDKDHHHQLPGISTAPAVSPTRIRHHFHHQQQHQSHHHHATFTHGFSAPYPLVQPLSTLVKPLPMEPESASSPSSCPQPYHLSHRPQRANSASSTSSSASFLSPRSPSLSPPPPIDQTDIIYPKNFIQLPPLQQEMHIGNQGQHREAVSDLIHTVSIFG